jgi:phage regulator Rha-like protein
MNAMTNMLSVQTMTSREIADLTGKRHDNVLRVCRDLIESGVCPQIEECNVINDLAGGRSFVQYRLQKRDSFVLVARLSPEFTAAVVDRWQELEAAATVPVRALSPAQLFLQNAQAMVDMERRQDEQDQAVAAISHRVEQVEQTQLLTTRPQNSESITHLRGRAAKHFGLPERIVEYIIRQTPYAPRPAGMVRNERQEAEGATYAVYWIKDINDVMRRFVKECVMVTPSFATHPLIEGRFKLTGSAA